MRFSIQTISFQDDYCFEYIRNCYFQYIKNNTKQARVLSLLRELFSELWLILNPAVKGRANIVRYNDI